MKKFENVNLLSFVVDAPGGSVLLRELVSASNIGEATANPQATPLLHNMSAAHAYIQVSILP
jgi:E3 ubiquitin-protein ligase HUWE1